MKSCQHCCGEVIECISITTVNGAEGSQNSIQTKIYHIKNFCVSLEIAYLYLKVYKTATIGYNLTFYVYSRARPSHFSQIVIGKRK